MEDVATRAITHANALASAAEYRGAATSMPILQGIVASTDEDWVRDAAALGVAEFHFQTGHFDLAIRQCEQLLDEQSEPTTWRGQVLRIIAESWLAKTTDGSLPLDQIEQVEEWLAESERIFENNVEPARLGQVYQAKGALACRKGDLVEGAELIAAGRKLERSFSHTGSMETPSRQRASVNGQQPS